MDGRDDEVVVYKFVWVGLESKLSVSDLLRGYWQSNPGKQSWTLTEMLYRFDIRLPDNPIFYKRSNKLSIRGKARNRVEFLETSDTVVQRTRQQCSHLQVIDAIKSVDTSLTDEFRQPGKSFEGFAIERCIKKRSFQ